MTLLAPVILHRCWSVISRYKTEKMATTFVLSVLFILSTDSCVVRISKSLSSLNRDGLSKDDRQEAYLLESWFRRLADQLEKEVA